jgi:hypothetical protein
MLWQLPDSWYDEPIQRNERCYCGEHATVRDCDGEPFCEMCWELIMERRGYDA